jgi:hypothetical protein
MFFFIDLINLFFIILNFYGLIYKLWRCVVKSMAVTYNCNKTVNHIFCKHAPLQSEAFQTSFSVLKSHSETGLSFLP